MALPASIEWKSSIIDESEAVYRKGTKFLSLVQDALAKVKTLPKGKSIKYEFGEANVATAAGGGIAYGS